jgi:hypothetical protein
LQASAELTVLTTSAVYAGDHDAAIAASLAFHACCRTGERPAAGFWDSVAALDTSFCACSNWETRAGRQDAIGDGVFYLIKHCAFVGPTRRHVLSNRRASSEPRYGAGAQSQAPPWSLRACPGSGDPGHLIFAVTTRTPHLVEEGPEAVGLQVSHSGSAHLAQTTPGLIWIGPGAAATAG